MTLYLLTGNGLHSPTLRILGRQRHLERLDIGHLIQKLAGYIDIDAAAGFWPEQVSQLLTFLVLLLPHNHIFAVLQHAILAGYGVRHVHLFLDDVVFVLLFEIVEVVLHRCAAGGRRERRGLADHVFFHQGLWKLSAVDGVQLLAKFDLLRQIPKSDYHTNQIRTLSGHTPLSFGRVLYIPI